MNCRESVGVMVELGRLYLGSRNHAQRSQIRRVQNKRAGTLGNSGYQLVNDNNT